MMRGAILLGAVIALSFAFYTQHVWGLVPCELCIWQRWGYAMVILFALISLFPKTFLLANLIISDESVRYKISKFMWVIVSLLLTIETSLALYHSGIEQHWWQGFTSCSSAVGGGTLEEIKARLMATPLVRCDEPQWYFLGLSMAAWNVVYAALLLILSFIPSSKAQDDVARRE